jgi:hypothetical protein
VFQEIHRVAALVPDANKSGGDGKIKANHVEMSGRLARNIAN